MKVALQAESHYTQVRDLLQAFCRVVAPAKAYRTMRALDEAMAGRKLADAADLFCTNLAEDLPFRLFISLKKESLLKIVKGEYRKSPLMLEAFSYMGEAAKAEEAAVVLCRMKLLGTFIIHNVRLPKAPEPRIIIPAVTTGIDEVQIVTLATFDKDWQKVAGKKGEK